MVDVSRSQGSFPADHLYRDTTNFVVYGDKAEGIPSTVASSLKKMSLASRARSLSTMLLVANVGYSGKGTCRSATQLFVRKLISVNTCSDILAEVHAQV